MRVAHVFDAVGDEFARRQRIEHAVVAHGDAVVDGDGVEFRGKAALRLDEGLDFLADLVEMHVSGDELRERIDNCYNGFPELFLFHAV